MKLKLNLKQKMLLMFAGVLTGVTVLDTMLASYFTYRQNQEFAFATLERDLLSWHNELQDMTSHMRSVALSAIGETLTLNQLAELNGLEFKLASAMLDGKEVKEAARALAFSKSVSLDCLHLVLRSGGFSAINVYINGQLSHQVSESEVGMFVQRGNGGRVWVKAATDNDGDLPVRNWPAWQEGQQPVAASLPPVDRPQVAFAYPSADNMMIEVAVPVEGMIDQSLPQGKMKPPELSVLDSRIAGSVNDPAISITNQPSAAFTTFAVVVFQKRIDQSFLQAVARKTGMWPLLFSPDGRYRQQLGPLNFNLQQLLPNVAQAASQIRSQTISSEQGFFYAAALPWQFERQPGLVLALVSSRDNDLHNIQQTVVAILTVTGLILAFSIGVGIFWTGRFINPIIILTNAVRASGLAGRLERGQQSGYHLTTENLHPLVVPASGEIGDLAWAFDRMIAELRYSFDSLEQRVQERTVELRALHQALEEQNRQLQEQSIELHASNSSLREEISERKAVELARESALAEAERLAQLRSEFIARMSHELRTPLNGILGYAQILLGENKNNERHSTMLNVIQQSGEYLLNLINNILDFAKIEAGKQELSFCDVYLPGFMSNISGIVGVKAEQKCLSFVCDIATDVPAGIRVDEMRLRQVLLNLLSNAVKYTERGQICLQVTVLEPGRLRFKVQDSGIGIDSEQLETIFRPFEQAGDSQNHSGGTGLGLVISRELVRLMGSDIHVISRVGMGSTFWFDLDAPAVDICEEIVPVGQYVTGYSGLRRRVLVVDDVDINRSLLLNMLSHLGFETAEANGGMECLESAGIQAPDLVLLDMVMPGMNGLETASRLRQLPGFGQTPIIAVSASAFEDDISEALEAGVNAFISKPVELKKLTSQIADLLKLDWVYALPEIEPSPQHKLDEWLEAPPMAEMEILHQMALEGSMRDITSQAEYLEKLDDRYRPFAGQLRKLSQAYQSKAVLDLVERYINRIDTIS